MVDLEWFIDVVKGLGIAGGPVFAVLWWLERLERREAQKSVNEFLVQLLTTTNQVSNSIAEVTKVVAEVAKDTNEVVRITHALAAALRRRST